MEYVELSGGVYLLAITAFQTTNGNLNKALFHMPLPVFGALLSADALSRLNLI